MRFVFEAEMTSGSASLMFFAPPVSVMAIATWLPTLIPENADGRVVVRFLFVRINQIPVASRSHLIVHLLRQEIDQRC